MEVVEARALAHRLLADELPQRWAHVQGVAQRAELFVARVPHWDALRAAAILHDIGYAKAAADSGFHQLDGARYLRRHGWDEAVVNLVAHHSGAEARARLGGLGDIYEGEFLRDESLPHQALQFCDMTIALDGTPTTVRQRLADMWERHRKNPVMVQFLNDHEAELITMVDETWTWLGFDATDQSGHPEKSAPMAEPLA